MDSLKTLLDSYLFSGVPSNLIWDLIKKTWEQVNKKSWDELYLDSFKSAFDLMQPIFSKYTDGIIEFDKKFFRKILLQKIEGSIDSKGLAVLTSEDFANIVAKIMSQNEVVVLGGNNLNQNDYAQLIYNLVLTAKSIFRRNVLENEAAFRHAMLVESKNNMEAIRDLSTYLFGQFDIVLTELDNIVLKIENQGDKLDRIENDLSTIKSKLKIDRPIQEVAEEIRIEIEESQSSTMFSNDGLCKGFRQEPRPNQYFLAQEFNPDREDLRQALSDALTEFNLESIRSDDFYWGGPILCKISALIQSTRFGVYQLTASQNRNVYLEIGIAIGQRKPFILIKDHDAEITTLVQGLEYFPINGYLELRFNLRAIANPTLTEISQYKPHNLLAKASQRTVIVAHGGGWDAVDFSVTVASFLQAYNLKPVILSDSKGKISYYLNKMNISHEVIGHIGGSKLDETTNAIQSSRLGIYRIDREVEADTFVALGISMGLSCPGILIHKTDPPSDLRGLSALKFSSDEELKQSFLAHCDSLLQRCSK